MTEGQNTSLCYLERDGAYLMLHRTKKQNDPNYDKWIGVGGKFEKGESPEECARREVEEETGFLVPRFAYRGIVTFASDTYPTEYMHLFTAPAPVGTPRACTEGDLAWVKKEAVLSLPLWEGDRIFLGLLAEEEPFFSLKLVYHGDRLVAATLNGVSLPLS